MAPPTREIGYAQNTAHGGYWWMLEDETTPELVWPNSVIVYDSMRRTDAQVASVLRAVTLPVRRTPWRIDPNGARDEVVELVATDLGLPIVGEEAPEQPMRMRDRFSWPEHLRQALLMLTFGHSYFEMTYRVDKDGNRAHLHKLAPRPAKTIERIEVARDGGLEWIKQYPAGPGGQGDSQMPIPVSRLVAYIHDREGGNWLGSSVLRPAYKNWLIKDRLLRVQAQTIERNGMGIPLYKGSEITATEGAAADAEMNRGLSMATAWRAGEAAGTAVPNGADLVLRGVEGDLPDALPVIKYHDEQTARAVLAHFLNLDTQSHGSYALGASFMDFFTLSLQTLAQQIADTATMHVIEDLVDANWGEDEPTPRLVFDEIGSRQAATAQAIKLLIDAGIIHPDDVLEESERQRYGLPPADPDTARVGEGVTDPGAMVSAIDAYRGGKVAAAAGPDFNRLHPRGRQGRFRTTFTRVLDSLTKWAAAGGKGEPLPESEFSREQLRRVGVARGLTFRRGAAHGDIRDSLLDSLRDELAGKGDTPKPDEPDEKPKPAKKAPAKKATPRAKKAAPKKRASLTGDAALAAAPIDFTRPHPDSGLTAEEEAVFADYVVDGAYRTNPTLRDYKGHLDPHDDETAAEVRLMDAAMSRSPLPADVLVERGISYGDAVEVFGGEERWRGDLTESTVLDHAFMSTTARVGGGAEYAAQSGDNPGDQATLRIRVPAGTKAIKMSGSEYEDELLLERGLTLRVISDSGYDENGGRVIEAEVVGKPVAPAMMMGAEFDALTREQKVKRLKDSGFDDSLIENTLGPKPAPKPDSVTQARQRQADIDTARGYADAASQLDEMLANGASTEAVLARLDASGKRHGTTEDLAPVRAAVEEARQVEVENRIRAAYRDLSTRPGSWVALADVRDRLGDVDRSELDGALERIAVQPGHHVIPWDNRKALTDRDRAASVRLGGDDAHAIRLEDPSDRPVPDARAEMARILSTRGITQDSKAGDAARFTPGQHQPIGDLREGQPVEVVRPGFTLSRDGEQIRLTKATVEAADEPAAPQLTGHIAEDTAKLSGWKRGDKLIHNTRGEVTYIEPDDRDSTGTAGGGSAQWVKFDDGTAGMVSADRLSGYVAAPRPPVPPKKTIPSAAGLLPDVKTGDRAVWTGSDGETATGKVTRRGSKIFVDWETGRREQIDPTDVGDIRFVSAGNSSPDLATHDPEVLRDSLDLKRVPELKEILKSRGLRVSGRKRELVDRLVEDMAGGGAPEPPAARTKPERPDYFDDENSLVLDRFAESIGVDLGQFRDPKRDEMVPVAAPIEQQFPFGYSIDLIADAFTNASMTKDQAIAEMRRTAEWARRTRAAGEPGLHSFDNRGRAAYEQAEGVAEAMDRLADALEGVTLPKRKRKPSIGEVIQGGPTVDVDESRYQSYRATGSGDARDTDITGRRGGLLRHRGKTVPADFKHETGGVGLFGQPGERPQRPGLTRAENVALDLMIIGTVADALNGSLRQGHTDHGTLDLRSVSDDVGELDLNAQYRDLLSAIRAGRLASDATLFRGSLMRPVDISRLVPGAIYTEAGFLHTSTSVGIAHRIIRWRQRQQGNRGRKPVIFRILAPKGTRAALGHEMADEAMLGPGRRMRVVRVEPPQGKLGQYTIIMELLFVSQICHPSHSSPGPSGSSSMMIVY